MDNVTHSLAGFALSRAGLGRMSAGATTALVVGSNLPDIDAVSGFFGSAAYLEQHRGLTHSIALMPVFALALALALRLVFRQARLLPLLLCSAVGIGGHIFMDLCTSYGTRALLPFDGTWYAWDLTFIIDPFVLALLLASTVSFRRSAMGPQIAGVGLGLLLTYVGARAVLHAQAMDAARDALVTVPVHRLAALPYPFTPFKWSILADSGPSIYSGELDLNGRRPALTKRDKLAEDAVVSHVRETSGVAAVFLDFSRFPWLEVADTPGGRSVSWRDLRFEQVPGVAKRDRPGFLAQVVLGPDGRIRSESIRF
jgi:inner membrane protein